MKTSFFTVGLLLAVFCNFVFAEEPDEAAPAISTDSEGISATTGEKFSVTRHSSHFTHLNWTLNDNYDHTIIEFIEEAIQQPSRRSSEKPTRHDFVFKALRPGKTTITFDGEDRREQKKHIVNVTVEPSDKKGS